jgi:hypothetical protein
VIEPDVPVTCKVYVPGVGPAPNPPLLFEQAVNPAAASSRVPAKRAVLVRILLMGEPWKRDIANAIRSNAARQPSNRKLRRGEPPGNGVCRGSEAAPAVSVTVTVAAAPETVGVTAVGAIAQVASCGAPVQLSVTDWEKPPTEVSVAWRFVEPLLITTCGAESVNEKSWPVPWRLITCGLLAALSVIVMAALRAPPAVGVNVMLTLQIAAAASDAPQLLVWPKSPPLAPLTAMLVIGSATLPVFVSVTDCAALVVPTACPLNVTLDEESETDAPCPIPVSEMP